MSKTNIKMSQPTYIVKKDDGVIICKITTKGSDAVFKYIGTLNMGRKLKKKFGIFNIEQPLDFISVVRHHKSDVWNEVVGKRIAESKCKKKIYSYYNRLYRFILQETTNTDIKDLVRYVDNLGFCESREEKHFKELIGNED